jgi:hypothetical protein
MCETNDGPENGLDHRPEPADKVRRLLPVVGKVRVRVCLEGSEGTAITSAAGEDLDVVEQVRWVADDQQAVG